MNLNTFFLLLCIGLITMITLASILVIVVIGNAYGQQVTVIPDIDTPLENEAMIQNLSISFENGTVASLNDTTISQDRGDYLISILNIVLGGAEEDELPTYSQVELEDILAEEQEPEIEEEIEDSNDNNDDNDNGEDPPNDDLEPTIEPPQENGSFAILTKGCSGGGYYENDPNPKCYPINDDGELQTEPEPNTAYCTALGCAYNPPFR